MPKDAFNEYAENRMPGFITTHSQIARQLALYYIDDDDICHPRFKKELSNIEMLKYVGHWAKRYFVPNPYTPSFPEDSKPTNIYSFLFSVRNSTSDINDAFYLMFDSEVNEVDKAKAYLLQFTDLFIRDDNSFFFTEGTDLPVIVDINRNDKLAFFNYFNLNETEGYLEKKKLNLNLPLQVIYYGAPGTGKSHEIKRLTAEAEKDGRVFRTTFHPDTDYSTFVGCYKPTMKPVDVTTIIGKEAVPVMNGGERLQEQRIVYAFTAQAFVRAYVAAWRTAEPVYLVIEEINRGNCAQIFGDLFQLLDRDSDGRSEYAIDADTDLQRHLADALDDSPRDDVPATVRSGQKLMLPGNLHIWATMNTSDQSLFPIDSAFKRRWQWRYIPIRDAGKGYRLRIGGDTYDWWEFLKAINARINHATSSEDKKLGYFFAKADEATGEIAADQFVGKVLFYLWNDVFKNYGFESEIFNKEDGNKIEFSDFFTSDGSPNEATVTRFLHNLSLSPTSPSPEDELESTN